MLESKKIIVLGSKGMLGRQVVDFFLRKNQEVITIDNYLNKNNIIRIINKLNRFNSSIIINCVGKIKQKKSSFEEIFFSNALLPYHLSLHLDRKHLLIHPSTDCVFDGQIKYFYPKKFKKNAKDTYGISKSLAELFLKKRNNTLIIRVSIIGFSLKGKDLFSWLYNSKAKKIYGYTNHYWNGITTLEWCKIVEKIIKKNNFSYKCKIIQLGTIKKYSKYNIVLLVKKKFNLNYKIKKKKVDYINRCLKSDLKCLNITNQLLEFKKYWSL